MCSVCCMVYPLDTPNGTRCVCHLFRSTNRTSTKRHDTHYIHFTPRTNLQQQQQQRKAAAEPRQFSIRLQRALCGRRSSTTGTTASRTRAGGISQPGLSRQERNFNRVVPVYSIEPISPPSNRALQELPGYRLAGARTPNKSARQAQENRLGIRAPIQAYFLFS